MKKNSLILLAAAGLAGYFVWKNSTKAAPAQKFVTLGRGPLAPTTNLRPGYQASPTARGGGSGAPNPAQNPSQNPITTGGIDLIATARSAFAGLRQLSDNFFPRGNSGDPLPSYVTDSNFNVYEANAGGGYSPLGGIRGPSASNPIGLPDVDLPDSYGIDYDTIGEGRSFQV